MHLIIVGHYPLQSSIIKHASTLRSGLSVVCSWANHLSSWGSVLLSTKRRFLSFPHILPIGLWLGSLEVMKTKLIFAQQSWFDSVEDSFIVTVVWKKQMYWSAFQYGSSLTLRKTRSKSVSKGWVWRTMCCLWRSCWGQVLQWEAPNILGMTSES